MTITICTVLFLSTLSLRRATIISPHSAPDNGNFYPRSPCGERRFHYDNYNLHCVISIHALLAESDREREPALSQSSISIHALLAESDVKVSLSGSTKPNFYPRSPCGERLNCISLIIHIGRFLSTLSLRRATVETLKLANAMLFLSTLSLRRATVKISENLTDRKNFYPRSPCGERPWNNGFASTATIAISIHALLAESDIFCQ